MFEMLFMLTQKLNNISIRRLFQRVKPSGHLKQAWLYDPQVCCLYDTIYIVGSQK